MDLITNVEICDLSFSPFLRPRRISFSQQGKAKHWDCFSEHDDVVVLIYNTTRDVLIFVKQFRPAVYFQNSETSIYDNKEVIDTEKYPAKLGLTIEMCSGIVDKDKSVKEIAQAEVLEECGYDVPLDRISQVTGYRQSGMSGALSTLFFAQVTDAMCVGLGGGVAQEGEMIDVVEMSPQQAKTLMMDENVNRDLALVLALQWFFTFQMAS